MYYQYPNAYGQQYPGFPAQYGMGVPTMPKAKYTQPLTPEMISRLRANGDSIKVEVSEEDLLKAACTHKENGQPTLVSEGVNPQTGNEILRCTICGETFEMIDASKEEVQNAVDLICNLLQTSKTMYLDAPAQLITQYYQLLPLLKMFPKLYERSQKNFAMYENAMTVNPGTAVAGTNGFQMMGAMLANPFGAYGYTMGQPMGAPQPMGYYPAPAGTPQQAPQMQPGYHMQPGMMMGNPFAYNGSVAPAPAPAPAAGYAQAPAPGVVPAAPEAATAEVTKQFNV